jgi:hypothetical protein
MQALQHDGHLALIVAPKGSYMCEHLFNGGQLTEEVPVNRGLTLRLVPDAHTGYLYFLLRPPHPSRTKVRGSSRVSAWYGTGLWAESPISASSNGDP